MKLLVKMTLDFGRCGSLESLFICTEDELESLPGKFVDFGEALGKNSEVSCTIDVEDLTVVSEDQLLIVALEKQTDKNVCGLNPFDYI